jgi:hypothetical protein
LSFASPIDVQTHFLPPTPETAAGEIERAMGLGLDGLMMYSNVARRPLSRDRGRAGDRGDDGQCGRARPLSGDPP